LPGLARPPIKRPSGGDALDHERGEASRESRKNALKHELNVRVWSYPELQDRADAIVARLLPEWEDPGLLKLAWAVAEAHVDVERVQAVRARFVAQIADESLSALRNEEDKRAIGQAVPQLLRELEKLDRYARRTLSKRKFAIREFDQAQREIQKRHETANRWRAQLTFGPIRPMYLPQGSLASVTFFADIK
jgi:hypothetical protein